MDLRFPGRPPKGLVLAPFHQKASPASLAIGIREITHQCDVTLAANERSPSSGLEVNETCHRQYNLRTGPQRRPG